MNLFGLTANLVDACILTLGKSGKVLNARGNRICFLIDAGCLSYWFVMDIQRGLISQGISCLISIGLAIYGFRKWGKAKSASLPIKRVLPSSNSGVNEPQELGWY